MGGRADISAAGFILIGAFRRTIEPIIPSAHSLTEDLSLHRDLIIINYRPHRSALHVCELTSAQARGQRATEEDVEADEALNKHGRLRLHIGNSSQYAVRVQNRTHTAVFSDKYVYCKLQMTHSEELWVSDSLPVKQCT